MGWLAGIMLFLVFVAAIMSSVSFRKAVGIVVIALVGLYVVLELQDNDKSQSIAKAYVPPKIIKQSEIEIVDLRLNSKTHEYIGKVRNNSKHRLGKLVLRFQVKDCIELATCEIVGEKYETVYLNIPPGQARGAKGWIRFENLPEIKKFEWDYSVFSIVAK